MNGFKPSWTSGPARLLAAGLLLSTLASCSTKAWLITGGAAALVTFPGSRFNRFHSGAQMKSPPLRRLESAAIDTRLAMIEFDDHGWFLDPNQPRIVVDSLAALATRGNIVGLVYVHGWRHNIAESDRDVASFRTTLVALSHYLQQPTFQNLRKQVSGNATTTLVGIHIGWRGKSWPEFPSRANAGGFWGGLTNLPSALVNLPVYFTFFSRKAAAERVGHEDLGAFLGQLDALFTQTNKRKDRLMSMVVVGHSFGAQAVFNATREKIESNIATSVAETLGPDAQEVGTALYPPTGSAPFRAQHVVKGFGDLVVLINPAIEADSYRRIDQLVHAIQFPKEQVPILLTVSARNDLSRRTLFKTGRWFSTFGSRFQSKNQAQLMTQALGSYEAQVTHHLDLVDHEKQTLASARRSIFEPDPARDGEDAPGAEPKTEQGRDSLAVRQIALPPKSPGGPVSLIRITPPDADSTHKPALVVEADPSVINSHSDFFRAEFIRWLADYVLDLQKQRLVQVRDDRVGKR